MKGYLHSGHHLLPEPHQCSLRFFRPYHIASDMSGSRSGAVDGGSPTDRWLPSATCLQVRRRIRIRSDAWWLSSELVQLFSPINSDRVPQGDAAHLSSNPRRFPSFTTTTLQPKQWLGTSPSSPPSPCSSSVPAFTSQWPGTRTAAATTTPTTPTTCTEVTPSTLTI